jgi:CspA family cold shock protein
MATGIVKFYNRNKRYGFILDSETQKDVFVHYSGLIDTDIKENDEVTFDIEIEKKKNSLKAVNVTRK